MNNRYLNQLLEEKIIDNEVAACVPGMPETAKLVLRKELRERLNLYKSYSSWRKDFWPKYESYLKTKQWKEFRQTVFKRDGFKCLLCSEKATHCHHISYGSFVKFGDSKRLECASLCKTCHEKVHNRKIG